MKIIYVQFVICKLLNVMQLRRVLLFVWIIFILIALLNGPSIKSKIMELSNVLFVGMKNLHRLFEKFGKKRQSINSNFTIKKLGNSIATIVTAANWRKYNHARQSINASNAKMSSFVKPASNSVVIFATASFARQLHRKNGDNVRIEKGKRSWIVNKAW